MEQTFKVVKGYSMKFTLISTITAKATDYVKMIQKIQASIEQYNR